VILARYAEGPAELVRAIAGLDGAGLDAALDDESWTIRQIVHHIVDGDDIPARYMRVAGNVVREAHYYEQKPV
jgi:hypothetical protein